METFLKHHDNQLKSPKQRDKLGKDRAGELVNWDLFIQQIRLSMLLHTCMPHSKLLIAIEYQLVLQFVY